MCYSPGCPKSSPFRAKQRNLKIITHTSFSRFVFLCFLGCSECADKCGGGFPFRGLRDALDSIVHQGCLPDFVIQAGNLLAVMAIFHSLEIPPSSSMAYPMSRNDNKVEFEDFLVGMSTIRHTPACAKPIAPPLGLHTGYYTEGSVACQILQL